MRGSSSAKRQARRIRAKLESNQRDIDIKQVAESQGIRVYEEDFSGDTISGLMLRDEKGYIIAVNKGHADTRKRFTIAHELGHFLLHKQENLHYDLQQNGKEVFFRADGIISSHEREANHFAAELLMPEDMIREDFQDNPDINKLANIYKVSESAMMYRLSNLNLV